MQCWSPSATGPKRAEHCGIRKFFKNPTTMPIATIIRRIRALMFMCVATMSTTNFFQAHHHLMVFLQAFSMQVFVSDCICVWLIPWLNLLRCMPVICNLQVYILVLLAPWCMSLSESILTFVSTHCDRFRRRMLLAVLCGQEQWLFKPRLWCRTQQILRCNEGAFWVDEEI